MRRLAFAVSIFVNLLALAFIWMLYPRGIDYGGAMTATLTYLQVCSHYLLLPAHSRCSRECATDTICALSWRTEIANRCCAERTKLSTAEKFWAAFHAQMQQHA